MKVITLFATPGPVALSKFTGLMPNNLLKSGLNLLMDSLCLVATLMVILI